MKHNGKSLHRLSSNPAEKALHEAWQEENDLSNTLEYLLGDDNRRGAVAERDALVAATVIQWLGSPCGANFLRRAMSSNVKVTGSPALSASPCGLPGSAS